MIRFDDAGVLRRILGALAEGVSIQDSNFRILYQNTAHQRIMGDHAGKYCYAAYAKKSGVCEGCPVEGVFRDGAVHTVERAHATNGPVRYFEIVASPLRDERGEIVAGIEVAREITARKEAEIALRQSERDREEGERKYRTLVNEFNALLDAIPDDLSLYDRSLTMLWANKAISSRVGTGRDDLTGKTCYSLLHDRSEPCEHCVVLDSFRTGKEMQDTITSHDGRIWDVRAVPLRDESGSVEKVVKVGRDITDHRKLEDQLRQAQKMEAIGQLAGGVAHDFNNILTAVIGYSNMLQMKLAKDDPLRSYVEQILGSAERAASLTHSLLAFSRKQILNPKPADLNEIVRKVERLLRRLIGEDVDLRLDLSVEPLVVLADSGQIEQIMMNLATNARDAMPDGGSLLIETGSVDLGDEFVELHEYGEPGVYAMLAISDTGEGMDEVTRQRIFEPFFTTKDVDRGTGLGLSMVYGIVKQHNGFINCYSEAGRGTTFKIYLPLTGRTSDRDDRQAADAAPVLRGGDETILVAEDDPMVRRLTVDVLTRYGYRVIEAEDGDVAIAQFSRHRDGIDLLLLDVIMPGKNGKEVFAAVRAERPEMKALFLSGHTANIIHKKGILDEGLHFILKPVTVSMLLQRVRQILDGRA